MTTPLDPMDDALGRLLRQNRADSFAPFFVGRVMTRLERAPESLATALNGLFRRLALAGALAVALLAVYNVTDAAATADGEPVRSTLETVLALPSLGLDAAVAPVAADFTEAELP